MIKNYIFSNNKMFNLFRSKKSSKPQELKPVAPVANNNITVKKNSFIINRYERDGLQLPTKYVFEILNKNNNFNKLEFNFEDLPKIKIFIHDIQVSLSLHGNDSVCLNFNLNDASLNKYISSKTNNNKILKLLPKLNDISNNTISKEYIINTNLEDCNEDDTQFEHNQPLCSKYCVVLSFENFNLLLNHNDVCVVILEKNYGNITPRIIKQFGNTSNFFYNTEAKKLVSNTIQTAGKKNYIGKTYTQNKRFYKWTHKKSITTKHHKKHIKNTKKNNNFLNNILH